VISNKWIAVIVVVVLVVLVATLWFGIGGFN